MKSQNDILESFDPNNIGVANGNYFGLPFTPDDAQLVILPAAWEVTTSYGGGTAQAPQAILEASLQVDLYDEACPDAWQRGIATLPLDEQCAKQAAKLRKRAEQVISALEAGRSTEDPFLQKHYEQINSESEAFNLSIYQSCAEWMDRGKIVATLGGDHSVPLGAIRAVAERHPGVGILHIDAHADLREAYEGFTYSHASIMYNALMEAPQLGALVQVGVRDLCDQEAMLAQHHSLVTQFSDRTLSRAKLEGVSWSTLCQEIVAKLPAKVYVSFDIDGLSAEYCPSTGTPVPGGLSYPEAIYLLEQILHSGREIVGFDLCEVAPNPHNEWDANVGARLLYKLCNLCLSSTPNR